MRAIVKLAQDNGWQLDPRCDVLDENVDEHGRVRVKSGGAGLEERPKLRYAIEEVEAGRANFIIAERLDRFFRNLDVQRVVIDRVEAAGGRFVAVMGGAITHATAEAKLQATINGAVAEHQRESARRRSWDAVEVAIEQGKVPWSQTAPGYIRDADSRLRPNPELQPVIERAFKMRAEGAPINQVRAYLRDHGLERSYHGTQHLLRDRIYLGEIHFGTHTPNLAAHRPIVGRETWDRVQRAKVSRGRRAKSERLLARLGVLRCASCGSRMVVGTSNNSGYYIYRCPPVGDCPRRQTISAHVVEDEVVAWVKHYLSDLTGTASGASGVADAQATLVQTQADLDSALRVVAAAGLDTEPAAVERLRELREARDRAKERHAECVEADASLSVAVTVGEWDGLTLDGRRGLIRATIEKVLIRPGRGAERIQIVPKA
jgi:DNA invertase Pin-like site-specific DNA recombinase